jgi:D-3-phosphoglycerate dehydrogenase / 2-oxoglutarate reductase
MSEKISLLVNLPPTFFTHAQLHKHWQRLEGFADLRKTSYNEIGEMEPDLPGTQAIIMWGSPVLEAEHLRKTGGLRFMGQINSTKRTVQACLDLSIPISETRACWSPAVAEMALLLALDGLRRVSEYHCAMRTGVEAWVNDFPADIDARERQLTGRRVGLVGFGGIGQRLAELLQPFHVDLMTYDPYIPEAVIQEHGARRTDLDELVSSSEVLVLCATNQESARGLLNRQRINALAKDAVLVNIGRSMLVDMPALEERLRRGDLVAMLDVFDQEPLQADSPLRSLPNTYLTPHRAGGLMESVERALDWLTGDLQACLEGRPLRYAVTGAMLPSFPE